MRVIWQWLVGVGVGGPPRRWIIAAIVVCATAALAIFWHFGHHTAHQVNNEPLDARKNHDQVHYLEHAWQFRNGPGERIFPRQHMPGYGALLAPFMHQGEGIWEFFWRAKTLVVSLSLVAWLALIPILRLALPWGETLVAWLAAGLLLYVFRAGYFQPELLFNSAFLLVLILMLRQLERPRWAAALVTGAAAALTHFLKAAMLPAVGLFVVAALVSALQEFHHGSRTASRAHLAGAVLVPLAFVALLWPYLSNSRRVFGSAFYSVHSKYAMWVDTHEEVRALAGMRLSMSPPNFSEGWLRAHSKDFRRDVKHVRRWEKEGLPSAARYLAEHAPGDILRRIEQSAEKQYERIKRDYHGLWQLFQGLAGLVIAAGCACPGRCLRLARRHALAGGFYALFVGGYLAAYVFYAKVGMGPRLMLTLALPLMLGPLLLFTAATRQVALPFPGGPLSLRKLGGWALLAVTIVASVRVLGDHIHWVLGGQ